MKIQFLGSGSAWVFAEENYQSNMIISTEVGGKTKNLLFDCGTTIPEALNHFGTEVQDLDGIFVSHLHADHIGGIEYVAYRNYFEQTPFGKNKINLYANKTILQDGWNYCWKGGMESVQGQRNTLESYFDTHYLEEDEIIDFYGINITPVKAIHVVNDEEVVPTYGIFVEGKQKAFITGDSSFSPALFDNMYKEADVIFQDCEFNSYPNGVHAQFHELCDLKEEIKEKMWLYHYSLKGQDIKYLEELAISKGFAGLVRRGDEFDL